ncbi:LytTR family transcriptional regulator DNA-binding domain-containing protein [Flammeovirga yaeyamensis]|uniref:LytTR family transcriptional regulator DNA-binding domain-containing protein n=1 Tax=Flammeovirga yaeyamensis TaxID=367791 RepID=A0AAX1ND31_9BACT|nr:LytTR family DNA-binding domain-containing protein [Flammeovirga yaeyamensis]MBB3696535.1 DNA-binding LytR/AlgR family response regulator [Flammeovirga yaeyamensis]NMF33215.1 response regulator transcription factor [Flammeovirga yaeyamensis]QWG05505.1 LytTR family transcriptional regulator DNA-binding domain-containing protein [Flammeovirga yaeyamensis]
MKIVIIEDEYLMAEELESLIINYNTDNEVVAKLTTVEESISYLNEHPMPDLFFSDIQLPDGLSFEIFDEINCKVPVVFCTAYDEYALEAFKVNGIDYILKPFDNNTIGNTLEKVNRMMSQKQPIREDFSSIIAELRGASKNTVKKNILIFKGEKIIPINTTEIAYSYLEAGVTYIYTFDNQKYVTDQSLDTLESNLGNTFYRVNRQFLVNREAIDHVSKYFARKLLVEMKLKNVPDQIVVSKAKASDFLRWLQE